MSSTFVQPAAPKWGGNDKIQRDRYGRPMITPPTGGPPVAYTRATTFIDAVSDKSNLMNWWARMAALGLSKRSDLLQRIIDADESDTKTLNQVVDQAAEYAGARRAAEIGTQIHEATEQHDRGEPPTLMGEHQSDVDAYVEATKGFRFHAIEQFRVQDELKVGGTADRLVHFGDELIIADIKTGSLWDTGAVAMQLSMYANSVPFDTDTQQRTTDPHPVNLDRGLLIHLPAGTGTCTLHWVNLRAGWEAVQIAHQVREWRKFHKQKATRGEVIADVTPAEARLLAGL